MTLCRIFSVAVMRESLNFGPFRPRGTSIFLPQLTCLAGQGLMMDFAVHAGTLLDVILYFWSDQKSQDRKKVAAWSSGNVVAAYGRRSP